MTALEISLFMKGLWFVTLNTVFFEGHIYQEHLYKFLRMRQALSHPKPFFV